MGKKGLETKRRTEKKIKKASREEWRRPDVKEGQRKNKEIPRSSKKSEESHGRPRMILTADAALLLRALVLRAPHTYLV